MGRFTFWLRDVSQVISNIIGDGELLPRYNRGANFYILHLAGRVKSIARWQTPSIGLVFPGTITQLNAEIYGWLRSWSRSLRLGARVRLNENPPIWMGANRKRSSLSREWGSKDWSMVADILIPPTLNEKSRNVQPVSPQPQPHNNNNLSLLVDRESSILKLNRFEFGIIWRCDGVIRLVTLNILYGRKINVTNPSYRS